MRFSIIVPVYNVEKYLKKCLDSVLCQQYKDYELIVVDDGSSDSSGLIADEYALRYPDRVRVIHQKNKGLGGARNTGINASVGEYLTFIDSDDYIADNYLERIDRILSREDLDILMFDFFPVTENGKICGKLFNWENTFEKISSEAFLNEEPTACNKVYKRMMFKETGIRFPEHLLYEDLATIPMFVIANPQIGKINEALYYYLQRSGSIMKEVESEKILQIINAMERVIIFYRETGLYEKYYKELEWMALRHVLCRSCERLLLPIKKTDWNAIKKLNLWVGENFPNYKNNSYYIAAEGRDKEYDHIYNILREKYRYVQIRYYGKIRLKKRIKRLLFRLKLIKG